MKRLVGFLLSLVAAVSALAVFGGCGSVASAAIDFCDRDGFVQYSIQKGGKIRVPKYNAETYGELLNGEEFLSWVVDEEAFGSGRVRMVPRISPPRYFVNYLDNYFATDDGGYQILTPPTDATSGNSLLVLSGSGVASAKTTMEGDITLTASISGVEGKEYKFLGWTRGVLSSEGTPGAVNISPRSTALYATYDGTVITSLDRVAPLSGSYVYLLPVFRIQDAA